MAVRHTISHTALPGDTVVLLHGFWMSRWVMWPLGQWLARRGFHVEYFAYPTATMPITETASMLQQRLFSLHTARVHLIGHSLGGLVIRQLFQDFPQQRAGCVITLGTPHRGSEVVRRAVAQGWAGRVLGANRQVLADGFSTPWKHMNPLGSVAGRLPVGALGLIYGIERPHDGLISVAETRVEGSADHVVLPVSHLSALFSQDCYQQISHFLENRGFIATSGSVD